MLKSGDEIRREFIGNYGPSLLHLKTRERANPYIASEIDFAKQYLSTVPQKVGRNPD
jgi:hypothetical protein